LYRAKLLAGLLSVFIDQVWRLRFLGVLGGREVKDVEGLRPLDEWRWGTFGEEGVRPNVRRSGGAEMRLLARESFSDSSGLRWRWLVWESGKDARTFGERGSTHEDEVA
jgi:hypothetical protein